MCKKSGSTAGIVVCKTTHRKPNTTGRRMSRLAVCRMVRHELKQRYKMQRKICIREQAALHRVFNHCEHCIRTVQRRHNKSDSHKCWQHWRAVCLTQVTSGSVTHGLGRTKPPKMSLSPHRETHWSSIGGTLCGNFKFRFFLQSKSVNNFCFRLSMFRLHPWDTLPGLCPWTPLGDFRPQTPWAISAPQMKIPGVGTTTNKLVNDNRDRMPQPTLCLALNVVVFWTAVTINPVSYTHLTLPTNREV